MNELIHAALAFALRLAGGKACAFSVDEAGTLSPSGEARSDVLSDPSGEQPEAGYLLGAPPRLVGLSRAPGTGPAQSIKICVQQQTETPIGRLHAELRIFACGFLACAVHDADATWVACPSS